MLNLLGCSMENFLKLTDLMNYRNFKKGGETYLKYSPKKANFKSRFKKKDDNPINILTQLSLK